VAAVLAAVLVFAPAALAVRVHVRVEGKTQTIFGATEPPLSVKANALGALDAASRAGEFYYHVRFFSFGAYVDQIGLYPASGSFGWNFKVDGVSVPKAADTVQLRSGATVLWYWGNGGEPTLLLKRTAKRGCYRAFAQDKKGKLRVAVRSVLHVDGRAVPTKRGRACLAGPHGLVRATMRGAIRSNALP
jgi:hypothetical protein